MKFKLYIVFFLLFTVQSKSYSQLIENFIRNNDQRIIAEYFQFLSIPNVAADSENIQKNTAFILEMMRRRNITPVILNGRTPHVTPAVYGEVKTPGAIKTIGFYAHYDGQPVNPKQWHEGLSPFVPVFISAPLEHGGVIIGPYRNEMKIDTAWRISGRGSADDKAGVMAILNAFEYLVKTGNKLHANIKFLFEGEEEVGSIHLNEIFEQHTDLLHADCWVVIDGPRHISGRKAIAFGVRGDVNMALTIYGPVRPLHSGNYGNWAPNPAWAMVKLLASMKDDKGKVTIPGFYDDVTPLSAAEIKAIQEIPDYDESLKKELGIYESETPQRSLATSIMLPTLNINGMQSANVGAMEANIIPAKAEAVLDLRVVKGNDYNRQVEKVVSFIQSNQYHIIKSEPTMEERRSFAKLIRIEVFHGYNAQRTPMDLPLVQKIITQVKATTKEPLVLMPSMGGSLPLYLFEDILKTIVITIPIVNYDNNQHAENENVKIKNLYEGIETIAAVMMIK